MKTGWRIALYLIIMTVAGFFEFKDILFSSSSPAEFKTFEEYMKEEIVIPLGLRNYSYTYDPLSDGGRLALPNGRNGRPLPI